MEDIWFRAPVEIGCLLYFDSHITYTEDSYIQTRISAEVGTGENESEAFTFYELSCFR